MAEFYADDRARESRLAAIRARRGTAEREAHIAEIAEQKQKAVAKKKSTGTTVRKTREISDQYHGHPWDEWDQMRDVGLDLIKERAAKGEFVTLTQLWEGAVDKLGKPLGNSHFQLPALLEHIALKGLDETGLLVTAVVTYQDGEPTPGPGLFALAASKGLIPEADAPKDLKTWTMTENQRAFWQQQVDAVFAKFASS
jgi:hypothetical protein